MIWLVGDGNAEPLSTQRFCARSSSALSASPRFRTFNTNTKQKRVRGATSFSIFHAWKLPVGGSK